MTLGRSAVLAAVIGTIGALADASAQTIEFGRQPDLVRAAQLGDVDGVRAMLQRGESPNITDTEGRTLLMHAISTGNPGLVALILDFDPRLETADRAGNTALHWAAEIGDADALTTLIDAGAAIDNTNRQGMTPLMMAARHGHPTAVEALLAAGASQDRLDFTGRNAGDWAQDSRNRAVQQLLQ